MNVIDVTNSTGSLESLLEQNRTDASAATPDGKKNERLQKACNDFETILTKTFLKEGMKTAKELGQGEESGDDEIDNGSDSFREIAYEQLADFMGKRGSLGLGKMLYNSFNHKIAKTTTGADQ